MLYADITGVLALFFLLAAPLAFVATLAVRALYRRRVVALMLAGPKGAGAFSVPPAVAPPTGRLDLVEGSFAPSPLRLGLALRHGLAGAAHAATAATLFQIADSYTYDALQLTLIWAFLGWPAVPLALHVAGLGWRSVVGIALALLAVLIAVVLALSRIEVEITHILAPAYFCAPPALAALLIANRAFRATSVLVFLSVYAFLTPLPLTLDIALGLAERGMVGTANAAIAAGLMLTIATGAALALAIAWIVGKLMAGASDQMAQADALWLIVTLWQAVLLAGSGPVVLFCPLSFLAYRATLWLAGRIGRGCGPGPELLLLRVFGDRAKKEALSAGLLTDWRHTGPVTLIGAGDLATETMDAQELSAFLRFRLRDLFIAGPKDLARLGRARPAADGLWPMRDHYCHDATWQPVVQTLMSRAAEIVLDARGFRKENAGVTWEIGEMLARADPARIRILWDGDTDIDLLRATIRAAWERLSGGGQSETATLRLVRM